MMIKELATNVLIDGRHATILLSGDINAGAEQELDAAFQQAAATHPEDILLDFSRVEYINSTGLALIVGVLAAARKARLPLQARGLSDHYRELFEITRLSDFMTIL